MIVHAYPHPVLATIPEALVAVDHRAIYGDPIDSMLGAVGAGTVLAADARYDAAGRVIGVELDVALADLDGSLETLRTSLCTLGAPGRSVLHFTRRGTPTAIVVETGAPVDDTTVDGADDHAAADGIDDHAPAAPAATSDGAPEWVAAPLDAMRAAPLGAPADAMLDVPREATFDEPRDAIRDEPCEAAIDDSWQVTTVALPIPGGDRLDFDALIQYALDQGTAQVAAAGSPLNAFLVHDTGRAHFFVCLAGDGDPTEVALRTLRAGTERADACALVLDTRITLRDGSTSDAILVMASRRGEPHGVTWAQAYRPKGWLRKFKLLPFREQVATSRSLFDAADEAR